MPNSCELRDPDLHHVGLLNLKQFFPQRGKYHGTLEDSFQK